MKIILPANIYSAILGLMLPDTVKENIEISASSLISNKLAEDKNSLGLLPSFELLSNPDLYVSGEIALSFDGALSNSYLYFMPDKNKFDKILMRGDVSSNEVLLSKIIFKERFELTPEIVLDTADINFDENNYLICGQDNNDFVNTYNGISFADQIAEFIDFPYVNYVLASYNSSMLTDTAALLKSIDEKIEDNIFTLLDKMSLPAQFSKYVAENIDTVYFELTENEKEGLGELLKLPFYHGMIEEIKELKFV
ncbi:MAG: hypothetical protein JW995_01140 [Melioribacteraceae bacterium]|nr:hypothetical protein [Melioribacteraceae bacterium]